MLEEVASHLEKLEQGMGRRLGDPADPLLVSVRSGAPFSMPGMMDTVLNLGLNDQSVEGLAKQTGSERFAWDSYRRLVQMYGKTVMGVEGDRFEEALEQAKEAKGVRNDVELEEGDLRGLVAQFKDIIGADTGREFPQDPTEQLTGGIEAVFGSWDNKRAVDYRRKNKIDDSLGTAVNIQAMVFGNKGDDCGTGVAFTRNPANGDPRPYGDYLVNAQGEDVVAGIRNTMKLEEMGDVQPRAWEELQEHMHTLETHYRDMCDIEFTVEQGKLWLLQTRVGKRTAFAEWIMAHDMLGGGLIDVDEALLRLDANRLEELFKKVIAAGGDAEAIARGLNASPGAAVGRVVFSADDAQEWAERGEPVILVRRETTPDDYHGMIRSQGILTSAGGTNSHAAVVARGEGIPAVCGADQVRVDRQAKRFTAGGRKCTRVTSSPLMASPARSSLVSCPWPTRRSSGPVLAIPRPGPRRSGRPMSGSWPGLMRSGGSRCGPMPTPRASRPMPSTGAPRGSGCAAPSTCSWVRSGWRPCGRMIFADSKDEEQAAYDTLLPLQRDDFVGIFAAMDGKPVTVRLLDPPLHEFLPDQVELAVAVALAKQQGQTTVEVGADEALPLDQATEMLAKVNDLHEANPMLGLRGVRLGILKPGLYAMQVRAIIEAAAKVKAEGGNPIVEIMIPLVATREELSQVREELEPVAHQILTDQGQELQVLWGTMIELPRAALVAAEIAEVAEFFSFGTNDLTQTAFGFSRDDIGKFLGLYEERKLVPANPFVTIDVPGVGRLMQIACQEGRQTRSGLKLGICGEHGGDPDSVRFCHELGLDYVSCSPFRVPTARLAAGQAALGRATAASK